jgi:cellulose synthase operon protein C
VVQSARLDELRRRLEKDPASLAFAQLAEELRRGGSFRDAVHVCRAGLTHHPTYWSARVTLGRALLALDQLDEAHGELSAVLRAAPENLAALRGVAEIHERRGERSEALAHYKAARALARHDAELAALVAALESPSRAESGSLASPEPENAPHPEDAGARRTPDTSLSSEEAASPVVLDGILGDVHPARAWPPAGAADQVVLVLSPGPAPAPGAAARRLSAADGRLLANLEGWLRAILTDRNRPRPAA